MHSRTINRSCEAFCAFVFRLNFGRSTTKKGHLPCSDIHHTTPMTCSAAGSSARLSLSYLLRSLAFSISALARPRSGSTRRPWNSDNTVSDVASFHLWRNFADRETLTYSQFSNSSRLPWPIFPNRVRAARVASTSFSVASASPLGSWFSPRLAVASVLAGVRPTCASTRQDQPTPRTGKRTAISNIKAPQAIAGPFGVRGVSCFC